MEIEGLKRIYQKHGSLFLEKILDEGEVRELPTKTDEIFFKRLACLITSKEAIFKACPEEDFDWQEISIRNISQRPQVFIKRPEFTKKIRVSLAINDDIVLSQALVV